ncbi:MAG: hypothetical protein GY696_00785, partial [Gammaproteobacteria bacterium]|nr:hypothetical protein [Gammaproteobacteria bacterium]
TIGNFNISGATQADYFGFVFTGYVNVTSDGTYTLYTSSDDGSKLYIGTTLVVNNDGLHGNQERSGQVGLKAGKHAIRVEFFEKTGGANLSVSYSYPGISKRLIPNGALYRVPTTTPTYALTVNSGGGDGSYASGEAVTIRANAAPSGKVFDRWVVNSGSPSIASLTSANTTLTMPARAATVTATYKDTQGDLLNPENPPNTVNGLDYKYYHGNWNALPNFNSLSSVRTGTIGNFDISGATQADYFGFVFTGYVNVLSDGMYTFYTSSDDGSKFYIGSTLVVNNDGLHGNQERFGQVGLKAGKHAIRVEFFEKTGGANLSVSFSYPGISKRVIPSGALYRVPTVTSTYALTVNSGSGDGSYTSGTTVTISANTAPSGKVFDRWVVNSGNPSIASLTSANTTLTMPARAATITATYKNLPP